MTALTCLLHAPQACLDLSNIKASLAALPIYISGCKSLIVLLGPTYASRLW
jgi:hypothetical protein